MIEPLSCAEQAHRGGVGSLVAIDDVTLVSSGIDGTVRLWHVLGSDIVSVDVVEGMLRGYGRLVPARDGCFVAIDATGRTTVLGVSPAGDAIAVRKALEYRGTDPGFDMAVVTPAGDVIAWRAGRPTVEVWSGSCARGDYRRVSSFDDKAVECVLPLGPGRVLVGRSDGTVALFVDDAGDGAFRRLNEWPAHADGVFSLAARSEGEVLTGGGDGLVRGWLVGHADGRALEDYRIADHTRAIVRLDAMGRSAILVQDEGERGILGSGWRAKPRLGVWRFEGASPIRVAAYEGVLRDVRGDRLVIDCLDGSVMVIGRASSAPVSLAELRGHTGYVAAARLLGEEGLVTGGTDGRLCLWKLP